MIKCTCYHSTPSQAITAWREQITPEQDATICLAEGRSLRPGHNR